MSNLRPVTDKGLRRWFNRINRLAFHGMLAETILEFTNSDEWIACTSRCRTLRCRKGNQWVDNNVFVVKINKKIQFSRSLTVIALAHEMVHVENWGWNHGPRFQNRLVEVVRKAKLEKFL